MMGMFDYVDYRGTLPKRTPNRSRLRIAMLTYLSQTKSVELWKTEKWGQRAYNEGCVKMIVTEDDELLDPDGAPLNWSGEMRLYGSGPGTRQWEFVATVEFGRVVSIRSDPS